MCSRGIQFSGGMGREMAHLITTGRTQVDMFNFDINRFDKSQVSEPGWVDESVHEAIERTYRVKYPTLQRMAGRNLRQSPLHPRLVQRGGFFGSSGSGFERPLFFLKVRVPLA